MKNNRSVSPKERKYNLSALKQSKTSKNRQ